MPETEESWTFRKVLAVSYTGPSRYLLLSSLRCLLPLFNNSSFCVILVLTSVCLTLNAISDLDIFSTLPLPQKSNLGVLTMLFHFSLGPSSRFIPFCCPQQLIVTADSNGAFHLYQNITLITPSKDRHLYIFIFILGT